jgi:hypothetical protein
MTTTEKPCSTTRARPTAPQLLGLSRDYLERPITDQETPQHLENVVRHIYCLIQEAQREEVLERYAHQTEQNNAGWSVPHSLHAQRAEHLRALVCSLQTDLATLDKHRAQRGFIHL